MCRYVYTDNLKHLHTVAYRYATYMFKCTHLHTFYIHAVHLLACTVQI